MARSNSFEGGTNGVTLTQGSGGNTGGASGDFLDVVDAGTGTVAFTTGQAAHGTTSMLIATGGVSSLAYAGYTLASVTSDYMRCYIRLTSLPGVVQILTRYMSGASQSLRVNVKAAGTIEVRDASNSVVGTTTSAVSTGVWWRLEMFTTFSATVGAVVLRLYNTADGTSVTDSLNLSGLTLTASSTALRYGVGAAVASIPNTWYDDVATEGATWHGPAVRSVTPTGIAVPAALGDPALSQTFSITPSGIAVPADLGSPTIAQALTVIPDGLAVPLDLGATALAQPMAVAPDGIAIPTALGDLAAAQQMAIVPDGIAVPVALGDAGVATTGGTISRPNTGTTARPTSGTIVRPFTGTVTRP